MIQKVSLYFILPMCFLAFFLALVGVEHIELGNDYYTFISGVAKSLDSWKLEIPDIPKIPKLDTGNYDSRGLILQVLIKIANFFVTIVNAVIVILNLLINILNIVIQLIQFILTLIYSCRNFIDKFRNTSVVAYV